MPFDATPATDPTVLYRTRRERACALWESLPRERFDLRCFGSGTTACALGWLARARMDGWEWRHGWLPPRPVWRGGAPNGGCYQHAAEYFGLTLEQARACFGNGPGTARTHRRGDAAEVTGADVAATLRTLPCAPGQTTSP